MRLLLIILFIFTQIQYSIQNGNSSIGCHLTVDTNIWKLIWEDTFDSPQYSQQEWIALHEPAICSEKNHLNISRCFVDRNVRYESGLLVLQAQREASGSYTGSVVTTKRTITHGRWEIRAAQPVGGQLVVGHYTDGSEPILGHFNLGLYTQTNEFRRLVVFRETAPGKARPPSEWRNLAVNRAELAQFHVYGLEWNESSIRYFFDDQYSEPILLDNDTRQVNLNQKAHLRFHMEVGDRPPFPNNFSELNWKCPTLIFDYVRFFELSNTSPSSETNCPNVTTRNVDEIRDKICARLMDSMTLGLGEKLVNSVSSFTSKLWMPILIVGMLLVFLIILTLVLHQLRTIKRQVRTNEGAEPAYGIRGDELYEDPMATYDYDVLEYDGAKSVYPHAYLDVTEQREANLYVGNRDLGNTLQRQKDTESSNKIAANEYAHLNECATEDQYNVII